MTTPFLRHLLKNTTKKIGDTQRRPTRKPQNPPVAARVLLATLEKKLIPIPNLWSFLKNISYEANTEWMRTTPQKTSNGQLITTSQSLLKVTVSTSTTTAHTLACIKTSNGSLFSIKKIISLLH